MNRQQWMLAKIAEEASEVSQRALKAMQFGLDECQSGQPSSNLERLEGEYYDLMSTVKLLAAETGRDSLCTLPVEHRDAKYEKMQRYLTHSISLGMVEPNSLEETDWQD